MEITENVKINEQEFGKRAMVLGYAMLSYAVGAGALFWLMFAAGGFAPLGLVDISGGSIPAFLFNAVLVLLFGVQHSVMARKKFKDRLVEFIPRPVERSTFVLVSGLLTLVIIALWQVNDAVVWQVDNPLGQMLLSMAYVLGIIYLLAASFVTNHFELFGLRQAWLYFTRQDYKPIEFKQRWMYRYSRHPMMLGFLFVFWCVPEMSVTRLTLALLFSIYIFVGIRQEEGGLIGEFGDRYRAYKKQVGMFFTFK